MIGLEAARIAALMDAPSSQSVSAASTPKLSLLSSTWQNNPPVGAEEVEAAAETEQAEAAEEAEEVEAAEEAEEAEEAGRRHRTCAWKDQNRNQGNRR